MGTGIEFAKSVDNESSKYWLSVLNELKNRGVKDILIICADGLSGIKEAIAAAFPKTEYQRCIVHQVKYSLQGTTQGRYLTGGVPPVRFSM